MDTCLLQQLRRQVNNMDSELADITHKILPLDSGEEVLMEERSKVKKILLKIDLNVERLLQGYYRTWRVAPTSAKQRLLEFAYLKLAFPLLTGTS